jgi:hypothetical protein
MAAPECERAGGAKLELLVQKVAEYLASWGWMSCPALTGA